MLWTRQNSKDTTSVLGADWELCASQSIATLVADQNRAARGLFADKAALQKLQDLGKSFLLKSLPARSVQSRVLLTPQSALHSIRCRHPPQGWSFYTSFSSGRLFGNTKRGRGPHSNPVAMVFCQIFHSPTRVIYSIPWCSIHTTHGNITIYSSYMQFHMQFKCMCMWDIAMSADNCLPTLNMNSTIAISILLRHFCGNISSFINAPPGQSC